MAEPDGVALVRNLSRVRVLAGTPEVAVVDTDGKLTVYGYADGDLRPVGMTVTPGPAGIVAVLPDGGTALAGDGNLWDLTDRWIPTRLAVPGVEGAAAAAEVRFVGDSRVLAVARRDGEVDLLDLADPRGHAAVRRVVPVHIGGAAPLPAVALSPNGDRLAAARVEGGAVSVTVADLHDPSRAARLPASVPASATRTPDSGDLMYGPGVALAFTPAGLLAVRSGRNSPAGPGSLTMWDVTDMARPRALGPPVPSDGLMSASRDGDLAIRFAGAPGRLQVVDVAAAGGPAPARTTGAVLGSGGDPARGPLSGRPDAGHARRRPVGPRHAERAAAARARRPSALSRTRSRPTVERLPPPPPAGPATEGGAAPRRSCSCGTSPTGICRGSCRPRPYRARPTDPPRLVARRR